MYILRLPYLLSSFVLFYLCLCCQSLAWSLEFTPQEQHFINTSKPILVHNETDWPPFNFNHNSTPQGISIDVMNKISQRTGLKVEYVSGPSWGEFMTMMERNELDVMLNIVDIEERRELFQFTTPYANSLTGVFTTSQKQREIFHFDDLQDKVLALPEGFDLAYKMQKFYPKVELLLVKDILACIKAIEEGRADAFMEEIGVVDYIISQKMVSNLRLAFQISDDTFTSELRIGVRKSDPILYSILQKGLNAISSDELHRIREKWLLKANEMYERGMVQLSITEKEFLHENNTVQICVDPTWPPLDFIDEQGKHSGLSSDLIKKIAIRSGISLELIPTTTWQQSLAFMKEGKCTVIPLMNETEETKSYIDFSQPYFSFATVIATRDDASFIGDYTELYGKKVVLQGHFFITEYVRQYHPQIEIIEVENTIEALKMVSEHKAYATIAGLPTVVNTIESLALKNVKIVGSVPQKNHIKLGVRKGNDILFSIFTKSINSITEKEKIGLYKKWFDIKVSNQFFDRSKVFKIAIIAMVLVILLLWRHFTLRKYTYQLKELNKKLKYTSTVDHLTKISNRKSIEKQLDDEIQRVQLINSSLIVAIFDIDHFKKINDTYGHIAGDKVLEKLASLVQSSIRKSDCFGRWGGEEFIIVLPDTSLVNGKKIISQLKEKIEKHDFEIDRTVTVCFGLGSYKAGETITNLLTRVDDYLYTAKNSGRNNIITHDED